MIRMRHGLGDKRPGVADVDLALGSTAPPKDAARMAMWVAQDGRKRKRGALKVKRAKEATRGRSG